MLNRLSVNVLLKSVVALLSAAIVVSLSLGAWGSWTRLQQANRIAAVAEASGYLFTALHNLRVDRSSSNRDLSQEKQPGVTPMLREVREAEMPALKTGLAVLQKMDFPQGNGPVVELDAAITKLAALHKESATALSQPKSARRPGIADDVQNHITALAALVDKMSEQLVNSVKLNDPFVDHLLELKQLAWIARNAGGDASVLLSNAMNGLPMPADMQTQFSINLARAETAWNALEVFSSGLPLPARFTDAMQKAKREFFSREFAEYRIGIIKKLLAKEKVDINPQDWVRTSVAKLATLLVVAEVALDTAKDHAVQMSADALWKLMVELGLLATALTISVGVMMLITRRIAAPLQSVQQAMLQVAGGNFSTSLPQTKRKDEIGQIVTAANAMIEQVSGTVAKIKASAAEVTNASAEIATSTTDLSQRTEEQAASLEETSSAMEQISSTVRKNAENANQARQSAVAAHEVADRGGAVAAKAVDAMSRIEELSGKIGDIIGVIDEIARQTNLLALNAAVEAARAGEAGRGFAVVATEVRSLAQRSSQAAKDIEHLITNSGNQVKEGVELVNQAGAALNEIVASIRQVASLVGDIANASAEQATGLDEVAKALTQMDEATQRNSALVEENAATAKTLEEQAKSMDEQVSFFVTEETAAPAATAAPAPAPRPQMPVRTKAAA